jgi:hypothetical protein
MDFKINDAVVLKQPGIQDEYGVVKMVGGVNPGLPMTPHNSHYGQCYVQFNNNFGMWCNDSYLSKTEPSWETLSVGMQLGSRYATYTVLLRQGDLVILDNDIAHSTPIFLVSQLRKNKDWQIIGYKDPVLEKAMELAGKLGYKLVKA